MIFFVACGELIPERKVAGVKIEAQDITISKILERTNRISQIQVKSVDLELLR